MRECSKCHISKPLEEFHRNKSSNEGRRSNCKACVAAWHYQHIRKSPEQRAFEKALREKANEAEGTQVCGKCNILKPLTEYQRNRRCRNGRKGTCRTCACELGLQYRRRIAGLRQCSRCKVWKPLTDYHRHPLCEEGRKGTCKACVSEWGKRYREKNADALKAKKKAYAQSPEGRAKFNAYKTRWLQQPEKRRQHMKAIGERVKARRRLDPAFRLKKMNLARNHYLKRYGSRVALAALFDSQLGRCANLYCLKSLKDGCHVDHIMPVALGGTNDLRNLQFLCPDCNFRKNKLHPDEWERLERERAA